MNRKEEELRTFFDAWNRFKQALYEFLRIPQIVKWVNDKITNKL